MSLFSFGRNRFPSEAERGAFYKSRGPIADFGDMQVAPRSTAQIYSYFQAHPGWTLLPDGVLMELSGRVADQSRSWFIYDAPHALEVLVFMTERTQALQQNFIPICSRNHAVPVLNTPEAHLYSFAVTFQQLSAKFIREIHSNMDTLPPAQISKGLEDAKGFSEAAFICDRFFLAAFTTAALAALMKESSCRRAFDLYLEGSVWAGEMGAERPHKSSIFDEGIIKNSEEWIGIFDKTQAALAEASGETP